MISDRYGVPLLQAGCEFFGLPGRMVHEFPLEDTVADRIAGEAKPSPIADQWIEDFLRSDFGSRLSHLIAIERAGPSHTTESVLAQHRAGPVPLADFERSVTEPDRSVCHNMRGVPIDAWTGRTHRLFETIAERRLGVTTIGIGDGGNEIGMGSIPWEILRSAITVGPGSLVPCRTGTDFTAAAGVSDWGGYALALACYRLRSATNPPADWNEQGQRELIERLVREAGAVDGVTGRHEPSVDGLPLETYLQVFSGIRALCATPAP